MQLARKIAVSVILLGTCMGAQATLVTSDPGTGSTTVFTATGNNGFGDPGPVVVDGITWTGSPQVTYGDAGYGLGSNGSWNWGWVATNNGDSSITADLGGGFSFVGGLINYSVQGGSPDGSDPLIQALAADMSVLESYNLWTDAPIVTAGSNGAEFRGISRASSDIYYLRLVGAYSIIHSLEVGAAAVPEPATLALMGLGIAGLGFARKKTQA